MIQMKLTKETTINKLSDLAKKASAQAKEYVKASKELMPPLSKIASLSLAVVMTTGFFNHADFKDRLDTDISANLVSLSCQANLLSNSTSTLNENTDTVSVKDGHKLFDTESVVNVKNWFDKNQSIYVGQSTQAFIDEFDKLMHESGTNWATSKSLEDQLFKQLQKNGSHASFITSKQGLTAQYSERQILKANTLIDSGIKGSTFNYTVLTDNSTDILLDGSNREGLSHSLDKNQMRTFIAAHEMAHASMAGKLHGYIMDVEGGLQARETIADIASVGLMMKHGLITDLEAYNVAETRRQLNPHQDDSHSTSLALATFIALHGDRLSELNDEDLPIVAAEFTKQFNEDKVISKDNPYSFIQHKGDSLTLVGAIAYEPAASRNQADYFKDIITKASPDHIKHMNSFISASCETAPESFIPKSTFKAILTMDTKALNDKIEALQKDLISEEPIASQPKSMHDHGPS